MSDLSHVEETMTEIRRNWNVMLQDQFNPIMVALEMLQNSNPSHDYESFSRLHGRLEEAMATIVEKYYTGFNNAVSIFGGIVDNTKLAREIVLKVEDGVSEFRDQIQFKRAELPEIWTKVQQYKDSFAVSGKLDAVQKQQSQAIELAKRRFFIPAVRTLMGAIYDARYLHSTQMIATGDLTKLLEANRDSMFDQIIDEIHKILYMKEMKPTQQLFSRLVERIPEARSLSIGIIKRFTEMNVTISDSDLVLTPTEFNFEPSSNAIAYLTSLIRASAILELIPQLLSIITQRIVSELYQITERTLHFRHGLGAGESPLFVPVLRGHLDRADSNEFDAFVPHLRRLCGRTLGTFLIIASTINIIGDTVEQIVRDAGSMVDIHAFYRNCLSAIHGEVKNWLASFLHGSKTSTRVFTSSTVAIVEALKGKKSVKSTSRAPLYQFVNVADPRVLSTLLPPSSVLNQSEEAAARKLASMLVVDPFSASKQDIGHRSIVKPNLQYLAIIYRPFAQFETWLKILFPEDQRSVQFVDTIFVENVLSEEYIPAIENYAMHELTRAFNSADALLWHPLTDSDQTLAIGRNANSLATSVSTFVGLISQVACVLHQVPGSQIECEQLMLSLMSQFLERCNSKFRDMVTNKTTEEASSTFVAISSIFVGHTPLRDLLKQHSMLTGAEDAATDEALAQKESLLLEQLKSDRSLHRNEIIFDYRVLRSIALLQRSLELLPEILADTTFGSVPSFPLFRPEFRSDETGRLVCNFFDGTARGIIKCSAAFETQYENFLAAVKDLAETCLFMLRIELRVHCFYFLDLAYREGNYNFEEACNEPDPYVSSLANDLIRFESFVAEWLPYSRYHVVMDELHQNLCAMLLSGFRYIRALNSFGCHKLQMNVATLEQILALISTGTSTELKSARDFYRLAAAGPDRFLELAPSLSHRFSMAQYQSIFDVYYRDNSGDASLRRTYNNQLVRLRYLLEETTGTIPPPSVPNISPSTSPRKNF